MVEKTQSLLCTKLWLSLGIQSVVHREAACAPPRLLLEMQTWSPPPNLTESGPGLSKIIGWFEDKWPFCFYKFAYFSYEWGRDSTCNKALTPQSTLSLSQLWHGHAHAQPTWRFPAMNLEAFCVGQPCIALHFTSVPLSCPHSTAGEALFLQCHITGSLLDTVFGRYWNPQDQRRDEQWENSIV